MDKIKEMLEEWLREILTDGIKANLSGLFDQVNTKVAEIAGTVGKTPQSWNSEIYNMLSDIKHCHNYVPGISNNLYCNCRF